MKLSIIRWNIEFKESKGKSVTLKSGIDSWDVLKDEKEQGIYLFNLRKETVLFNLECSYQVKLNDNDNLDERRMKEIVAIEANSLLSVVLRYNGFPPFPLLIDFEGSDDTDKRENKS